VVSIANGRENWLTGNQSAEYLKNALVRIAWASLGGLDQLPGAFTGVRTDVFHAAGGFPEDSLTEDYELAYRVMAFGVRRGRPPEVACVLRAQVFTHGPSTTRGFIRQRTRWFAGFLTTLARFRSMSS
jgi:cellulose synthase/poly-beta-1,6-N-acetylglucosamine synthase-like glycosyltransferase